jgi:hypothetical protein
MAQGSELSLGTQYFEQAAFGDLRRNKRMVKLFDAMLRHPGGTLPAKLSHPPDLRAFYRLMDADDVTHASVMEGHYAATRQAIQKATARGEVVLTIHDATELDYTNIQALESGLGQVADGTHRGYICHNSLAVVADTRETLGLVSQILHHRAEVPKKETDRQRRERDSRESRLWVAGVKQAGPAPEGGLVVDVSDSLSDTYEYMSYEINNGRHFLLRSREDRKLHKPINGHDYLYAAIRSWKSQASHMLQVPAQGSRPKRKTRVNVSFGAVILSPPGSRAGEYVAEPLAMWAVRIWEPNPPPGEDALQWILLSNVEVDDVSDASNCERWYKLRYTVEDFHKGMKTGCGIETMQFDTVQRLEPAIAVLSILATSLMKLRDAARQPDAETRRALEVVDPDYVKALCQCYPDRLPAARNVTVKQFYMHVARLGGHQNRKCDGFPGWITLWRGWMKLEMLVVTSRPTAKRQRRKRKKCGTN